MGNRVLVACVGNTLRTDDGVGPAVASILGDRSSDDIVVADFGIGGVHLVQALMEESFLALVVVDCADRGRPPGTVMEIEPEVLDVRDLDHTERYDYLADMHYTKPERALALARGLGVLPPRVVLVGIQPEDAESMGRDLTASVAAAASVAARHVLTVVARLRSEA